MSGTDIVLSTFNIRLLMNLQARLAAIGVPGTGTIAEEDTGGDETDDAAEAEEAEAQRIEERAAAVRMAAARTVSADEGRFDATAGSTIKAGGRKSVMGEARQSSTFEMTSPMHPASASGTNNAAAAAATSQRNPLLARGSLYAGHAPAPASGAISRAAISRPSHVAAGGGALRAQFKAVPSASSRMGLASLGEDQGLNADRPAPAALAGALQRALTASSAVATMSGGARSGNGRGRPLTAAPPASVEMEMAQLPLTLSRSGRSQGGGASPPAPPPRSNTGSRGSTLSKSPARPPRRDDRSPSSGSDKGASGNRESRRSGSNPRGNQNPTAATAAAALPPHLRGSIHVGTSQPAGAALAAAPRAPPRAATRRDFQPTAADTRNAETKP